MRITILGGGIVGLVVAGSLATRGVEVATLTRAPHADAIRARGLEVREQDGRSWFAPTLNASADIGELAKRGTDIVAFAAKSFDTEQLAQDWAAAGGETVRALSLQNTVRNEEILGGVFSDVAGAVVRIGGDIPEPGVVAVRHGRRVELGSWPGGVASWVSALALQLQGAGVAATTVTDIRAAKFAKLVLNVDSALTAVTGLGIDQVGDAASVAIRRRLRDEALAVAIAEGIDLPPLPAIDEAPVPAKPTGFSSTWYDLQLQRGRTETPWLNGHIVELAGRHRISAPANLVLDELVAASAAAGARPGTTTSPEILRRIEELAADA